MSISTTLSDVLIDGNIFLAGTATSDGATITSYLYTNHVYMVADATITNNSFSGITSNAGSGFMVNPRGTSTCIITNNLFIRGTSLLSTYISSSSSSDQIVVDNIFDSPTTDGTSELLASVGLGSIFSRNKNQTGYKAIALQDYFTTAGGTGGGGTFTLFAGDNTTAFSIYKEGSSGTFSSPPTVGSNGTAYTTMHDLSSSGSPVPSIRGLSKTIDLDNILPMNVRILNVKVGYLVEDSGPVGGFNYSSATNNVISLSLVASGPTNTVNSTNGIADIKNNLLVNDSELTLLYDVAHITSASGATTVAVQGDGGLITSVSFATVLANTNYTNINVTSYNSTDFTSTFITGTGSRMAVTLAASYLRATGSVSGHVSLYLSPIVVKFRW